MPPTERCPTNFGNLNTINILTTFEGQHSLGCCFFEELCFQVGVCLDSERNIHSTSVLLFNRRLIESVWRIDQIVDEVGFLLKTLKLKTYFELFAYLTTLMHLIYSAFGFDPFKYKFCDVDGENTRSVIERLVARNTGIAQNSGSRFLFVSNQIFADDNQSQTANSQIFLGPSHNGNMLKLVDNSLRLIKTNLWDVNRTAKNVGRDVGN